MGRYDVGELLNKVPLEAVITRLGIETERRGSQIRALCPFHQDTRPSLNLYPDDGSTPAHFHCFACGAHGTAIDLVKQVQGLEFLPAAEWLAKQFGIKPPRPEATHGGERKASIETALDFALRTFDEQHDAEKFGSWCADRQFDEGFLYRTGLRCIPRGVLVNALQGKDLGERAEIIDGLERLGLVKRLRPHASTEQGKLDILDQFRDYFNDGRIVIPIRGAVTGPSKIVAFAGRLIESVPANGAAKYLLTPGFDKNNYLFNAYEAFADVKQLLKNEQTARLYLVEGFFDALRLQSLGQPAVALMGVSLSDGQLELLKALVQRAAGTGELVYSVFLDSDAAGFGGANRLVRRLLDLQGVDLRWVGLPWRTEPALGKDPDACLRGAASSDEAAAWLQQFEFPAEGVLLAAELGSQDASDLQTHRWNQIASTARERALFRTALTVTRLYGHRSIEMPALRLRESPWPWSQQLQRTLLGAGETRPPIARSLYLEEELPRAAHARRLAYHGSRRGELPCDEGAWQVLNSNEFLFDQTALDRLRATIRGDNWHQAAPFDAVHLPRKLTAEKNSLDDPRRKVMPHPADLHAQQLFLNELLTQRHDRLSATGQAFSTSIPAVRWYSSRQEVTVSGAYEALNEPDLEWGEPKTLSFGYQIDMDVLEGDKTPSDQGMFRPFGQCWRDFMASLSSQCHAIGPRVHVLRLDAQRYYDSIQRYVVREELLKPLSAALRNHNPEDFTRMFGLDAHSPELDGALERLLTGLIFGHEFHDPEVMGRTRRSPDVSGIPQGPVLSAYIGTIAMFPVDDAARKFIRRHRNEKAEEDGQRRSRAGYARYVDDVVLFADNEELLKEFREVLQAKATEHSIDLIHKGESVRSGTPAQVMRQLNDGRGLAASVPAWEPPIVGDGEVDWSLGDDLPKVDRQCALQMLRHPALMDRPEDISAQVRAAISAPDLRASDLGLCARWLWWHVAAVSRPADAEAAWTRYWMLWNEMSDGQRWASAFKERGYDILFAVEGLDKLLDSNPWQSNGQFLIERDKSRNHRIALARLVCKSGFFENVRPATNGDHIRRREWLVAHKAWRLAGDEPEPHVVAPQGNRNLTAIEWLCLAGADLTNGSGDAPLAALQGREPIQRPELALALGVVNLLTTRHIENGFDVDTGLAIDFVVRSARRDECLNVLSKFPKLLSKIGDDQKRRMIPHLPVLNHRATSIYEIDGESQIDGRYLYRCSLRSDIQEGAEVVSRFVRASLRAAPPVAAELSETNFKVVETSASTICWEKSTEPQMWSELHVINGKGLEPKTRLAVRFFLAMLSMHQAQVDEAEQTTYVPFRPQLFQDARPDHQTLYLVADPVRRDMLGVSAWFHDRDERVHSENVPLAGADMWRVGWAVADMLGVAADMAGETGERDELLDEGEESDEAHARQVLENYVLRQQLRKLQGNYLSSAYVDVNSQSLFSLPKTVERALKLLQDFPADQGLASQVRHVILMEAESRAMAIRMTARSGDDLRHTLHRAFPDVLARLPLWAIAGLELSRPTRQLSALRPELALMLALYRALYSEPDRNEAETPAPSLRMALALATAGIGLRGSVASLWGYAADLGTRRMAEVLKVPADWEIPDMIRLDLQGDYRAIRESLFDGDWSGLCKASPWQWMLALIGLIDASFPQAFGLHSLKELFASLSAWQTNPALDDGNAVAEEPWPFDALPRFTLQQCENLVNVLPAALCSLDRERGMRVVCVHGKTFGRSRDTDEFIDATGAGWQLSKAQYTSLYANSVEEIRPLKSGRVLKVWTETRRAADDDLLAVHTLDIKLGKWLPSQQDVGKSGVATSHERATPRSPKISTNDAIWHTSTPSKLLAIEDLPPVQLVSDVTGTKPESQQVAVDTAAEKVEAILRPQMGRDEALEKSAQWDSQPAEASDLKPNFIEGQGEWVPSAEASFDRASITQVFDRLNEWQSESWKKRLGGESSLEQEGRISPHFRVALFQFRVDESYSHPMTEVGLGGLPLAKASQEALRPHLRGEGQLKAVSKAAQRNCESHWRDDKPVISWPEHRRRALLSQALKACRDLKVQLLVLPEVSVRIDTVAWLKKELLQHPGLAVLAGTYRHFGPTNGEDHLKEMLTLLWQPDKSLAMPFGLEGGAEVIEFGRGKKYRSVAAHELFKPDTQKLQPLYTEEKLVTALRGIRAQARKDDWSPDQFIPLLEALIHGPQKLRYCMELICSELFVLTSPANRSPLQQELAKMLQLFGRNPSEARELVDEDVAALGEILTFAQRKRERRSVLLVPACTSRSNDYWHAGQASVLASGAATVFCNAANKGVSVGGSCFIGIDSVSSVKSEHGGIVRLLTPYHGWSKGILQPDCTGTLSPADQALVVVDLDPVNVVSGKPRPQLLPEPMSLVAYLPVVEVIDRAINADGLATALREELSDIGYERLRDMLTNEAFPEACGPLHLRERLAKAWRDLLEHKQSGMLSKEAAGEKVDLFKEFFGDPRAIEQRISAWLRDRHQQPAPKAGEFRLEPAWLDFLVADLTWRHSAETCPEVRVPPWMDARTAESINT